VRERRLQVDAAVRLMGAGGPLPMLLASLDDKQRRVLLSLTALPGVPLPAQHVSGIAETADLEPALLALTRQGLVVNNSSRHQLAGGIGDQLRRIENLAPSINRAVTYFTAWAERYRRSAPHLLDTAEALVRAQQSAADARRWGEVLRLGRLLDGALVLGVRWGAWATVSREVRFSWRFAIRASRDTRSPRGLMKTYSAAQNRSAAVASPRRSASS